MAYIWRISSNLILGIIFSNLICANESPQVLGNPRYYIYTSSNSSHDHKKASGWQSFFIKNLNGSELHQRKYVESQEDESANKYGRQHIGQNAIGQGKGQDSMGYNTIDQDNVGYNLIGQHDIENNIEGITNTDYNPTEQNAIGQLPLAGELPYLESVWSETSSSSRSRRQETCMSMMWHRHLSHKITPDMKSSACHQYQKWGSEMKKGHQWMGDAEFQNWWSSLGLDAFRHRASPRRYRRQSSRVRKEYRVMTDDERRRFHAAVNTLKQSRVGNNNRYDVFVLLHQPAAAPGAHFGPAFLGWHRELLFRFENALREVDPEVTIPYWDSTLDGHLGDQAANAITWSDEFMGTRQGDVTSGPFAGHSLVISVNGRTRLHRGGPLQGPRNGEPRLMTDEDAMMIIQAPDMRTVTWFVDPSFEVAHGSVHNYVSGVFADLAQSASDPLFYLHHAFIDCLWEEQQRRFNDYQALYPVDEEAIGVGILQPDGTVLRAARDSPHYPTADMHPFGPLRNIDGVSNEYSQYYTYNSRPSCSVSHPSCDSDYLFCDMRSWQCSAKLRLGARCAAWSRYDPCHGGLCCDGVCRQQCWSSPPRPTYPPTYSNDTALAGPRNRGTIARDPRPSDRSQVSSRDRVVTPWDRPVIPRNNEPVNPADPRARDTANPSAWERHPVASEPRDFGPWARNQGPRPGRQERPSTGPPVSQDTPTPFSPVLPPTHPPEYFRRHQELERLALG